MDPAPQDLAVTLELCGPESCACEILDLRWGEALLAFPSGAAPVLLIGQAVEIAIRRLDGTSAARVRGFVSMCSETDEARRIYRFQIEHGDGPVLEAVVNRREAPRATPDPTRPVRVVLTPPWGGRAVISLLRDVSENGLSVLFAREEEWVLAPHASLDVELRLPSAPAALILRAEVRHRRLERTAVHYGFRLDPEAPGFEEAREALRAFVAGARGRVLRGSDRDSAA